MTGTFYIPKTMANWPWQRAINPHYEEMKAESNAWLKTFKPFNEKSQIAFDKCDFGMYFVTLFARHRSRSHSSASRVTRIPLCLER